MTHQVDAAAVGCREGNHASLKLAVLGFALLQEGGDALVAIGVVQRFDKAVLLGLEVVVQ